MRAILKVYSITLVIGALSLSSKVFAGHDPDGEKKKTYSKSYNISNNDKINLDNKFGELKINTWDKNEIKVDVTISAKANSDEQAQEILDNISIEDGKDADGVHFRTKIGDRKNQKWEKGDKQEMSIDYVVNMPARNPLYADNQFGALSIGDYSGEATFISKFGSFAAGKLSNTKKVDVEFGSATIASIGGGELTIKFSKAEVNDMDGSVHADFEFCDKVKLKVDNSVKDLSVKNSYSQLFLDLSTDLSASFDIRTSFSEMRNKSNYSIKEEGDDDNRHGPNFNHKYSGKAGSGNVPMKIKSEFGDVTLGHNLVVDMSKDDKKDKKHARSI